MNAVKFFLKKSFLTKDIYKYLKIKYDENREKRKFSYTGNFINRRKDSENLCIILAGYKEFAFDAVFGRIVKNQKEDLDICVISSGLYSERLDKLCEENGWSYLSTDQNNVCLAQNVAIKNHPKAKNIFKLDEDVFITERYFDRMLEAYYHAKNGHYIPGVLAPMLNINGYSSAKIIEKLGLVHVYEEQFGPFKYASGPSTQIESNPEFAKFMWSSEFIPQIDELDSIVSKTEQIENPCPYRFSIGAIMFERSLWEDMGGFSVEKFSTGMGVDEAQLGSYCFLNSRPIMVSENIAVGHLSFGKQNGTMMAFFQENPSVFFGKE